MCPIPSDGAKNGVQDVACYKNTIGELTFYFEMVQLAIIAGISSLTPIRERINPIKAKHFEQIFMNICESSFQLKNNDSKN